MTVKKSKESTVKRAILKIRSPLTPIAFNDVVKFTQKMCMVHGTQLGDTLNPRMVLSFISALFLFIFTAGKFFYAGFQHPAATNYVASACLAGTVFACNGSATIPWKRRTELYREFEKFSDDICNHMTSPAARATLDRANLGRRISVFYPLVVFFVWVCYTTMPIVLRQRRLSTEIWPMPCDISEDECLYTMYVFVAMNWISAIIVFTFHDVSHVAFVQYSITVFRALTVSLEDMKIIVKNVEELNDEDREIVRAAMHRRLDTLILFHQFVLRWTKEWTAINKPGAIARMIISPLIIVSAMIKMTQTSIDQQGEIPVALAIALGTMYIVSAISDGLDAASTSVAKGAYDSGWEFLVHDREYVQKIELIILRAYKPTRMPGIIDDITLHDFVQACKSGYSFFQAARSMMG